MEKIFWMILRDGSNYTTKRHDSRFDAIQEAKRLAMKEVHSKFYILKTIMELLERCKNV